MDTSLLLDKLRQYWEFFIQHPVIGYIAGGILLFIGTNSEGKVTAGNGFVILLGIALLVGALVGTLS